MPPPIFVHIPKTAGSTLRTLMTANYAPNEILHLYGDPKEILATAAAHIGKTTSYRLIQGHTPYGTHRFLGLPNARYLTFLRDPIDRFLSDIAHTLRHSDHTFHTTLAAPGLSRDQIISKALDINHYRNTMTQYVSGSFSTEVISLTQLGTAIDNLWKSEFVGLTEHFEASLLIMAKILGWKQIIPQKMNVRPDLHETTPPELKTKLNRALAYDHMLYAIAQEHFARNRKKKWDNPRGSSNPTEWNHQKARNRISTGSIQHLLGRRRNAGPTGRAERAHRKELAFTSLATHIKSPRH